MGTIFYMERNGRKYAYEATSKRVPGRKNPKTTNVYLGRVDPETGEIIPKKSRKEPRVDVAKLYGAVHLLDEVQRRIGVLEDLEAAFPTIGGRILGASMSQVIDPTSFDDIHYVVDGSVIAERLSLKSQFSSATMSDLSKEVGESFGAMDDFFSRRIKRTATDSMAIDLTSVSSYSAMEGWTEWGHDRDRERLKQINVAMVTDAEGVPTMFRMLPGSVADITTMRELVDDMRRLGCEGNRFVMDRGFESANNVGALLDMNVPFVIPSNVRSIAIKKLVTRAVKDMRDNVSLVIHDGRTYRCAEYELVVGDTGFDDGMEYLIRLARNEKGSAENNGRYDSGRRLRAFVVYDPEKAADDLQALGNAIGRVEDELDGKHFREPAKRFRELRPKVRSCLDWTVDDDGLMRITRKQKAITHADNRNGMFVMLTDIDTDWSTMMSAYDTRCLVETAFDTYRKDLDAGRARTGDPDRVRGRLFINFVALIMRTHVINVIDANRKELRRMTVEAMFRSLNTLMAVGAPGEWRLTAVTGTNRRIYEAFGIDPPEANFMPRLRRIP